MSAIPPATSPPSAHTAVTQSTQPATSVPVPAPTQAPKSDWRVIKSLLPYLWDFKGRVTLAITFLVTAKVANIGVPLLLKEIIDSLDSKQAALAVPVALLAAYGLLRLSSTLFGDPGENATTAHAGGGTRTAPLFASRAA